MEGRVGFLLETATPVPGWECAHFDYQTGRTDCDAPAKVIFDERPLCMDHAIAVWSADFHRAVQYAHGILTP